MKIIDMHCDTIMKLYEDHMAGGQESLRTHTGHLNLEKMRQGAYLLQNFALYVNLERYPRPFETAMAMADVFYQEIEKNADLIGVVKNYADIEENRKRGRMSALLTLEEGEICQGELSYLRDFYRMGARMMTLTWNFKNSLAWPNRIVMEGPERGCYPDTEHGLTENGIAFLEEMEKLGMIIDISHLNDAGIWDVFRYTKRPFVASHSNCRALASHPRNLTDEMLRRLGNRGGVAGINYCIDFLRDFPEGAKKRSLVSDMVRHMKHMKQIGGIGVIGLGSDYDGISGDLEMAGPQDLPLLIGEMQKQGFTESEIDAICYGNVLRVYREILR